MKTLIIYLKFICYILTNICLHYYSDKPNYYLTQTLKTPITKGYKVFYCLCCGQKYIFKDFIK